MTNSEPRVPRSSVQAVRSSLDALNARRRRKFWIRLLLSLAVLAALIWGGNYVLVGRPVRTALAADSHTAGVVMDAHLRNYVDPTSLILDLRQARLADTTDLWIGLMLAARALASGLDYDEVVLARDGTPVYTMSGRNFRQLADDYARTRNLVVAMRSLVPMLRLPGGAALGPVDPRAAALPWAVGAR